MLNPPVNHDYSKMQASDLILLIDDLKSHIYDLDNGLKTAIEHGDYIESQLYEANKQLKGEIFERRSKEIIFQGMLDSHIIKKKNLEIMLETVTEHSDQLDGHLLKRILDAEQRTSDAEQRAETDALTQLSNRGHFDRFLLHEWSRSIRETSPLAIIMIDIDFFKPYNDHYGHPEGDSCLKQVAKVIQSVTPRVTDLAARYGGEEFCIVLPNTNLEYAIQVCTKLHAAMKALNIRHEYATISNRVSLSIGAYSCIAKKMESSLDFVVKVDQLLYKAKQQGRDRTVAGEC